MALKDAKDDDEVVEIKELKVEDEEMTELELGDPEDEPEEVVE
jgi:hypothetical protein